MKDTVNAVLGERERLVLSWTVSCHIHTGEPVGSRFLVKRSGLDLSPATIRNTMGDLEEKGYLSQPHPSSGRIPTDAAYRFYVDELVVAPLQAPEGIEEIGERLAARRLEVVELIRETSRALSAVSRQAGVVLAPQLANTLFQRLEFRRVGDHKVLAICLSRGALVQTRLLEMEEDWSQRDLDHMSRIWNERFADRPLREVRAQLEEMLRREKAEYDLLVEKALELGRQALAEEDGSAEGQLYLDGAANILEFPEFAQPERMRALVRAIEEKSRLCRLLDRCLAADAVQVFIGGELALPELHGLSLVTAPYHREGAILGVLGVIGPTRMAYERIIPIVQFTASQLSDRLSGE